MNRSLSTRNKARLLVSNTGTKIRSVIIQHPILGPISSAMAHQRNARDEVRMAIFNGICYATTKGKYVPRDYNDRIGRRIAQRTDDWKVIK